MRFEKAYALAIVLLFVLAYAPNVSADDEVELHILSVENFLWLSVYEDTSSVNVSFVFPLEYGFQVPLLLEVLDDSTAEIESYDIVDDVDRINKLACFHVVNLSKGERVLIHFEAFVFVKGSDFDDVPSDVAFPSESELPVEVTSWLQHSPVVQLNNPLLSFRARLLRLKSSDDVLSFAKEVSSFIYSHRRLLFILQYELDVFFAQDAVSTLLLGGENVGRSHLASALFRNNGIPSRSVLALPDQGFWTQMHYMNEYYVPGYGWVLIDGTNCSTPYPSYRQVLLRLCSIEDEYDTKVDYIFSLMSGEERWVWLDSENVAPYYLDCSYGSSRSQMFSKNVLVRSQSDVEEMFNLSSNVFGMYEELLGRDLNAAQYAFFDSGLAYMQLGLSALIEDDDVALFLLYWHSADLMFDLIL